MLYYCSPSFGPHVLYIVISAVGRCEKPAAATTLLVGDGARLRVHFGVENVHVGDERLAAHEGAIEIRMAKNRAQGASWAEAEATASWSETLFRDRELSTETGA